MNALQKNYREIADVINAYVKNNTIESPKSGEEIRKILHDNGVVLNTMYQPTDLCYNRTTMHDVTTFTESIHLFKYVGWDSFVLLGENYKYTGIIVRKRKIEKDEIVVGEWLDGKPIIWNDAVIQNEERYTDRIKEEIGKIEDDLENIISLGSDREVIAKSRVNQSAFREHLLKRYKGCCICNVSQKELLLASHIKPWSVSGATEKTDVNNGLILCPNHDKLFDKGFISFDDDGKILVSSELGRDDCIKMNVSSNMRITLCKENLPYMKYHREQIFR